MRQSAEQRVTAMKSKISTALAVASCALTLSVGAANADIITLDVAATMTADLVTGASCLSVCTLGGSFVLDNSTGAISSPNMTMAGEFPSVGPFTTFDFATDGLSGTTSLILGGRQSPPSWY